MKKEIVGMLLSWALCGCNSQDQTSVRNNSDINNSEKRSTVCDPSGNPFGGGAGKEVDPYLICSVGQLKAALDNRAQDYYALDTDLDLSQENKYIGTIFTGVLDGRGHTLRNFTLNFPMEGTASLIGQIFSWDSFTAEIKNVNLENFNISAENSQDSAAGLVGANNGGIISNVHVRANIVGMNEVGGIAGQSSGIIRDSSFSGTLRGKDKVGGITGWGMSHSIDNCKVDGTVFGHQYVGGIVGYGEQIFKLGKNQAEAAVTGSHDFGKEIGKKDEWN